MLPDGFVDCRGCGQPTKGYGGGSYCADCEPARCRKCQRFVPRGSDICPACRPKDSESPAVMLLAIPWFIGLMALLSMGGPA